MSTIVHKSATKARIVVKSVLEDEMRQKICTHLQTTPAKCPICNQQYFYTATGGTTMNTENKNSYEISNSNEVLKRLSMERADAQIKTGLKLSEAVRLLEENPGAMLRCDVPGNDGFDYPSGHAIQPQHTWSVKLPPPKSVPMTRADVKIVLNRLGLEGWFEQFCQALGL